MALRSSRISPFQESQVPATTPAGTAYRKVTLNFAGQKALLMVPDAVKDWDTTSLIIMNHGYVDHFSWVDPDASPRHGAASAMSFLDQGWVVISHQTSGNNWGSDAALSDIQDAYDYVARRWFFQKIIIMGFSMGGMLTYNATGLKVLPQIDAAITINGVVDARTSWMSELYRVYGGLNEAQLGQYMAGHDPARDDPARWAGLPMFISSSPKDTVTPTEQHAAVFYERAVTPEKIVYRTHTGGHLAQESFMVDEVVAWLKAQVGVEPHRPGQVRPAVGPAPLWAKAAGYASGLLDSAGEPVALYSTAGELVSAAEA